MKKYTEKRRRRTRTQILAEKSKILLNRIEKLEIREKDQKYVKIIKKDCIKIIDVIDGKKFYVSDKQSILQKLLSIFLQKNRRNTSDGMVVE